MQRTIKQVGVMKGAALGAFSSVVVLLLSGYLNPFGYSDSMSTLDSLSVAIRASAIPAFFLLIAIARVANHRFLTPEDIDGGGLTGGSERVKLLQALLQNTLEQSVLAALVYCAWAVVMPSALLSVVPVAALCFGVARILFFSSYQNGAPSRALGFSLTFYPSALMLLGVVGFQLVGRIF